MPFLAGSASWAYKSLIDCGRFYPPGSGSAEGRLRHYATQFPLVEADASYYALPTPSTTQLWAERTPADFAFNVKAFGLFTGHPTMPRLLPRDVQAALGPRLLLGKRHLYYRDVPGEIRDELWRRFTDALLPLRAARKLSLVLLQFPPWVVNDARRREHVAHCVERMAGHTLAVEFRHRSWLAPGREAATLAFERELGVVHTVVDEPQGFDNSVPAVWEATHPEFALLRLHGRNSAAWNTRHANGASGRFNYDYPDEELQALAAPLQSLARQARQVKAIFNNCHEDKSVRNARTLMSMLAPLIH